MAVGFNGEEIFLSSIQNQLIERKLRLMKAVRILPDPDNLFQLLKEVDFALERIDNGTYGICEVCKDPIEAERLFADPLMTVCIDHLNDRQQRALELDLEYAGRIQRALLPKNDVRTSDWDFYYHYQPAGTVSGDFCDLIENNDKSMTFIFGDVSGKGVSASLMMSHLHALINSLLSFDLPIIQLIHRANRLFCESTLSMNYATMVVGKAYPEGTLEICVAGHNPPLIFKDGNVIPISATGIPIGMFSDTDYGVENFFLEKGDALLLYTDGLTEASNNGTEYGEKRIMSQLANLGKLNSRELIKSLLSEYKNYTKGSEAADDLTLAALKRL
jgi:phosphoserine phosphatase RsbU/P